jgi:hypothetical protein
MTNEHPSHAQRSAALITWWNFYPDRDSCCDCEHCKNICGLGPLKRMSDSNFTTAILETEVVVKHAENGHVYYFPIQSNGTVSLHGSRVAANPKAECEANDGLFDALDAAQIALGRPHT